MRRFSNTLMRWKMLVIWNERARPLRLIRCGGSPAMLRPVQPDLAGRERETCPDIRLNSVDLPAPFGPITACRSPARTSRLTPWITGIGPKDLVTPMS